jgi:crotonobetainyl-CoA:carnitine CoA-transferase CaiB-like acyl-CoA transferase
MRSMIDAFSESSSGPLSGIRVLDLTRVLAGPWASQLLADYGADVIKVERPDSGDDTRAWGPPWLRNEADSDTSDSAYYVSSNRNKRSLCVDLSKPEGAEIVRDLAQRSDVLLENFKVGTMAKFGLAYDDLSAVSASLIYCSITAYGQSGSRAGQPGYDAMIQASGGLMSITGEQDGPPQKVGVAIADIMAGMYATTAVLAALVSRSSTGAGQHIDVPLYDSQVAWLANQNMNFLIGGKTPGRMGSGHPNLVPYQSFPTADGHLMLAVGNDRQFRACLECLGLEQLKKEDRFRSNAGRIANRDELIEKLAAAFRRKTTAEWLLQLADHGVPSGPINTIAEVFSDDYADERQLVRTLPHPAAGRVPTVANPVGFSATPVTYRLAPPVLGQHTMEILASDLGMSDERVRALAEAGIVKGAS